MTKHHAPTQERIAIQTASLSIFGSTPRLTIFSIGCPLAAFLIPLKLSLAYIILVPLIVIWLVSAFVNPHTLKLTSDERRILVPLGLLFLTITCSSILGISLIDSLPSLISLIFFACTIMIFLQNAPLLQTSAAMIAGQSLAALHSFFEATFPDTLPRFFLGKVTESGQLALTIPLATGLLWYFVSIGATRRFSAQRAIIGAFLAILFTAIGFRNEAGFTPAITCSLGIATFLLAALSVRTSLIARGTAQRIALLSALQLPLLVCALLVNLKRGPWLGVLSGVVLFFAWYARRALAVLIATTIVIVAIIAPIRDRLAASYEHFTISGGRSTIWRIAADLVAEYPMGIGYHNSGIIRALAPEIPQELKHFHNNLLNIVAETGWIGAGLFIWFIYGLLRTCFSDRRQILFVATGCAIISWQVAGLVEYNVGDSEILILVWMLLGSLLYSRRRSALQPAPTPTT